MRGQNNRTGVRKNRRWKEESGVSKEVTDGAAGETVLKEKPGRAIRERWKKKSRGEKKQKNKE